MATVQLRRRVRPPDLLGAAAPRSRAIVIAGGTALATIVVGTLALQFAYALFSLPPSSSCLSQFGAKAVGVEGVCRIVTAMQQPAETALLIAGSIGGALAAALGLALYRGMATRRQRRQSFSGAMLGLEALILGGLLLWFRAGKMPLFTYQFLNWGVLSGSFGAFLNGAKNTLILAVVGQGFGMLLGLVLSLFALSEYRAVRTPVRMFINFFRGTPLLWQLSMFYFGLAIGLRLQLGTFQTAMLVFALNTAAYSAEIFRAGIQSLEHGQFEAARGLGFTHIQALRYAIVPQAVPRVIPPLMNQFVGLIKDTSLVIVLGLTASQLDLFNTAQQGYSTSFNATYFVAAAAGYLVICLPLIRIVDALEARLRSGLAGLDLAGQRG